MCRRFTNTKRILRSSARNKGDQRKYTKLSATNFVAQLHMCTALKTSHSNVALVQKRLGEGSLWHRRFENRRFLVRKNCPNMFVLTTKLSAHYSYLLYFDCSWILWHISIKCVARWGRMPPCVLHLGAFIKKSSSLCLQHHSRLQDLLTAYWSSGIPRFGKLLRICPIWGNLEISYNLWCHLVSFNGVLEVFEWLHPLM